jgi:hypothetical protein
MPVRKLQAKVGGMTEPKSNADRQREFRQRKLAEKRAHREAGRTAVTVHVRPDWAAEVRELEAKLQRRERRKPAASLSK